MTPELAKELKDAGFPQAHKFIWRGHAVPDVCYCGALDPEEAHQPALSELIFACKPARILLTEENEGEWFSFSNTPVQAKGKSPEEAVARLWLAINKK